MDMTDIDFDDFDESSQDGGKQAAMEVDDEKYEVLLEAKSASPVSETISGLSCN